MSLCNLDTPFERRRVIEYGVDGNKVVRHWYEMQHVIGPLYKGVDKKNEWGEDTFTVFVFFPGVSDGFTHWEDVRFPDRYTADHLLSSLERDGYASMEQMISTLDRCVECGAFIGSALITFVSQFNADRAEHYAKHRIDFYAKHEAEEKKRAEETARKEAEEEVKRLAALDAEKSKYLGWADKMTPLRFGKVKAQMEKLARFDGKVMTFREFIIQSVKDGWMPQKKDNVVTYYHGRESKPKTMYTLSKENFCYTISKTEFDFAKFLVSKFDS